MLLVGNMKLDLLLYRGAGDGSDECAVGDGSEIMNVMIMIVSLLT
jgi:hypothetical protein